VPSTSVKKAAALMLFLLVGLIARAPSAGGQDEPGKGRPAEGEKTKLTETLPEGEGRAFLAQACVQCHDLKNIVTQRKTAAGWRRTINEMIWRGAPLMVDEAAVLNKYLASQFGPDDPWAATPVSRRSQSGERPPLPDGEGRSLVLQACIQCHDLSVIVSQRKTAMDWQRTVNEMIRLGTQLTPDEAEVVTHYLAASFGR